MISLTTLYRKDFRSPVDETEYSKNEKTADSGDTQGQPITEQPPSERGTIISDQMTSGTSDLKRKRVYEKGKDDADDDERNQKRPRRSPNQPKDPDDSLKFACPYRKNNLLKYSVCDWPKCALTSLETVARVKCDTISILSCILSNNIKGLIYIETTEYSHVIDASNVSKIKRK